MGSKPAAFPEGDIPKELLAIANGPVELVWVNEAGGTTASFDGVLGLPPGRYFTKWNPSGNGLSLAAEAERMKWLLSVGHPTAQPVELRELPGGELLITREIDAISAVYPKWVSKPEVAIRAIAEGLRRLHEIPVDQCPYSWSVTERLSLVEDPSTKESLLVAPEIDRLVVCHGDACAPNTLIDADGRFAATIDVDQLGHADRWADLAVAVMSLGWNYQDYDESVFWDPYGVAPDQERLEYYQALWNAA